MQWQVYMFAWHFVLIVPLNMNNLIVFEPCFCFGDHFTILQQAKRPFVRVLGHSHPLEQVFFYKDFRLRLPVCASLLKTGLFGHCCRHGRPSLLSSGNGRVLCSVDSFANGRSSMLSEPAGLRVYLHLHPQKSMRVGPSNVHLNDCFLLATHICDL